MSPLPKSVDVEELFGNPCEQKPQAREGKLPQFNISKRPLKSHKVKTSALLLFLGPPPVELVPAETVKILETVKPGRGGSEGNKESAGQAAWQCTLCKRMFSSKKYIVSHMKEDHHVTKEKAIDLSITEI